jgi:hypothetical protein
VATEVGSDLTLGWLWDRTSWSHLKQAIVYFGLGGSLGLLSALVWPERLIGTGPLTGLSLILVPLSTAAIMSVIGARTRRQERRAGGLFQFWFAFDFGFAAALARFAMLKGWL